MADEPPDPLCTPLAIIFCYGATACLGLLLLGLNETLLVGLTLAIVLVQGLSLMPAGLELAYAFAAIRDIC